MYNMMEITQQQQKRSQYKEVAGPATSWGLTLLIVIPYRVTKLMAILFLSDVGKSETLFGWSKTLFRSARKYLNQRLALEAVMTHIPAWKIASSPVVVRFE
jgi:hypothetical protein